MDAYKKRRSISKGFVLMFFLLFFVLLIQFFVYWIFEPLAIFLEYVFEIRYLTIIALVIFISLFSAKTT